MIKSFTEFCDLFNKHEINILSKTHDQILQNFKCISLLSNDSQNDVSQIDEINKIKNESHIISLIQLNDKEEKYLIVCCDKTIILMLISNIKLIQPFFNENKNSTLVLLSNELKQFFGSDSKIKYPDYTVCLNQIQHENLVFSKIIRCILTYFVEISSNETNNYDRFKNFEYDKKIEDKEIKTGDFIQFSSFWSGSCSKVYLIYLIEENKNIVMKVYNEPENSKLYEREHESYLNLNHPLIPKYYGYSSNDYEKKLFLENVNGRTLDKINEMGLTKEEKLKIMFEIMVLIEYLHNKHYVYRDLKLNNLIIDKNKSVVLFDFDRLINLDIQRSNEQITKDLNRVFGAPELSYNISYEADIFSLGYLIYFIINDNLTIKQMDSIVQGGKKLEIPPNCEYSELINKANECISIEPEKRPKISELIDFFYFNYFSKIPNQISEKNVIESIKNIHDIKFYEYWACIPEYNNYYAQLNLDLMYDKGILGPNKNVKEYRSTKVLIKEFNNKNLQQIYSGFKFIFDDEQKILADIQVFKLLTYSVNENSPSKIVICGEKTCFIFNNNIDIIQKVTSQFKGLIFDVTQSNSANEDVDNFCKEFQDVNDQFVQTTIRPLSAFLIRRYLLPSLYFKDCSFFNFDQKAIEFYDRQSLMQTFISSKDMEKVKDNLRALYSPIFIKQAEVVTDSTKFDIKRFTKKDFIQLKRIISNDEYSFDLVFHIKSQYVFLLKSCNKNNIDVNMETFYKESNHDSFVHFYGFLVDNGKIVGFLYEYLNNGQLISYIKKNGEKINQVKSLIFLIRLYRAIDHLETNHLNPFKIELQNILLDHNNVPYILYPFQSASNFNEQYDSNLLFNKIGEIIYTFFEKKEYPKDEIPSSITECSENIQHFYQACIQKNNNLTINDFEKFIFNEFEFINFSNFYALKNKDRLDFLIIIDLVYEMIQLLIYMKRIDKLSDVLLDFFNVPIFLINKVIGYIPELLYQIGLNYENGFKGRNNYDKAKSFYEQAIELMKDKNGHSKSYYHLGNLYENGYGVKQDYSKAIHYYELAGENLYALIHLGAIYNNGLGVAPNPSKANEIFQKAINLQIKSLTSFQIAERYYKGEGLTQNTLKAIEYYEQSASENNKDAYFMLGYIYENGQSNLINQDFNKAKEKYELAGEKGNSEGYVKIGDFYFNGNNVMKQNFVTARGYYEKAALCNNPHAILKLGYMYRDGYGGLVKDENKANELFQKYIKIQAKVLLNFGLFIINGYGIEKNYEIAKKFVELSADFGCSNAFYVLGILYKLGNGVEQNDSKAKKYFKMFMQKGKFDMNLIDRNLQDPSKVSLNPKGYFLNFSKENSDAVINLGKLNEKGKGIQKINCLMAKKLYELASLLGNSNAFYYLGRLYERGNKDQNDFIEQDFQKAKSNYEIAAEQNNMKAIYKLGCLYEKGQGCQKDYPTARKCFENIINYNNNVKALYKLGKLYFNGKGNDIKIDKSIYYLEKCIENITEMKSPRNQSKYYYYEYLSHNYLGLIYLSMNHINYQQAIESHFINAGKHIFDYATNNIGLFYQFEKNLPQDALYYYQEAEKHDFSLSLFNLGYIYEYKKVNYTMSDDDSIKKAINYYRKASEYEDLPLKINSKLIYDEYFEISKTFIICFTNLKLTEYYIKVPDYKTALTYFKRVFSKLINEKNIFHIEINQRDNEKPFTYLRDFILNFEDFNLNLPPQNTQIKISIEKSNLPPLIKNATSIKPRSIKINEIEKKKVFNDPESFFNFVMKEQKLKNLFLDEINRIIKEMNDILYKPPYLILYGRMNASPIYQLPPIQPLNSNRTSNPRNRNRAISSKNNQYFNSGFNG